MPSTTHRIATDAAMAARKRVQALEDDAAEVGLSLSEGQNKEQQLHYNRLDGIASYTVRTVG